MFETVGEVLVSNPTAKQKLVPSPFSTSYNLNTHTLSPAFCPRIVIQNSYHLESGRENLIHVVRSVAFIGKRNPPLGATTACSGDAKPAY